MPACGSSTTATQYHQFRIEQVDQDSNATANIVTRLGKQPDGKLVAAYGSIDDRLYGCPLFFQRHLLEYG